MSCPPQFQCMMRFTTCAASAYRTQRAEDNDQLTAASFTIAEAISCQHISWKRLHFIVFDVSVKLLF